MAIAAGSDVAASNAAVNRGPTKECDVIMKGGITSGVIYPRLITTLAKIYTLRSFGGTSAGAIAAAAGAAAQLGKSTGANPDAFSTLDRLPNDLGTMVAGSTDSMLFRLFQPQPPLASLFALLKAGLNARSASERIGSVAIKAIEKFPLGALLGALPGMLMFWYSWGLGAFLAAIFALIGALVGAGVAATLCFGRELPANHFGLCNGMPGVAGQGPPQESLSEWLNHYINRLAGKSSEDPLTFGELWAGKLRVAGEKWDAPAETAPRVFDLAMITTGVNLGRPFRLPFESNDIYFVKDDMEKFFPSHVVSWLVAQSRASDTATALSVGAVKYHALPIATNFPIIVAVRLSLSFPILLSAVPFYIVDHTLAANAKTPTVATRVFFSDGGICSNFPIQFFDSALPTRPTFGADLKSFHPDHPGERVWMPSAGGNREGIRTYCPALPTAPSLGSVVGFVRSILSTMQNWQDQMQLIMPGFRDRIVHVCHRDEEGGMNLNMPPPTIMVLANSGAEAASELVERFATGGGLGTPNAWDNHQRIRVRTLLCLMQQQLESIAKGIADQHNPTWEHIVGKQDHASYEFQSQDLATGAADLLKALERMSKAFPSSEYPFCAGAPRPPPELKVVPRI